MQYATLERKKIKIKASHKLNPFVSARQKHNIKELIKKNNLKKNSNTMILLVSFVYLANQYEKDVQPSAK